ncbi:probable cytochrome P450 6v1 [Aricia agestis]|uniref:probable cytochrome P450 6v1 n=1 Tax=Aricia agestis TaxID=91739 RepID=UPI001C205606|nr:probable cytochrome P450 6v1 [Aricia agestis]
MALVANELLAFIQHAIDTMDEVSIMQICKSSFTSEEIFQGKQLLYETLGQSANMPSRRKDGTERSVQDIISLLKQTDPDEVLAFVAKQLHKLPPVTLDHVDVVSLLKDIRFLKEELAGVRGRLQASESIISDLRSELSQLKSNNSLCGSPDAAYVTRRRGAQAITFSPVYILWRIFNFFALVGQHPEVQERLHREVDILDMEYLEMVLNESMRFYPAIGFFGRMCVKNTTLPVGNIKIDKGTTIFLPLFALQHDERYYPEPEVFKPERFSKENKDPIIDKTFMPFGKGNRMCIGQRFATVQAKAGIVHLMRHFKVNTVQISGKKIGFQKHLFAARLKNVDLEFIDR